jgi:hypothetical protein
MIAGIFPYDFRTDRTIIAQVVDLMWDGWDSNPGPKP